MTSRSLLSLALPEGLIVLAAAAFVRWGTALPWAPLVVRYYPPVVLAAGLLLAWRFHRGRLLLALLALALADRAMHWLPAADPDATVAGPVAVRLIALALPATLAVLAYASERGVLTAVGQRRLLWIVGVAGAVFVLALAYPEDRAHVLDRALLAGPYLGWSPAGQVAAVGALAAVGAIAGRVLWRPDPIARGMLWAAVASFLAASAAAGGDAAAATRATLYFATAGLVLAVSTVESAYAMAYRDELTGLPGRRALNEALQRVGDRYTVAMVDVDHFKQFNDRHGHDVGDQVLRMVAARLARVTGGGRAFRYGGEEFTVLFPERSVDESRPALEELRRAVAQSSFTLRGKDRPRKKPKTPRRRNTDPKQLSVTVSIGAAQPSGRAATPDAVVKEADRALYRAKEGGRNRVEG